ncbi:hypothetical protein HMPREF1573_00832 [Gardnerella vaginalis JCP7276]|nr:hypothetical protein HMPREF1573_00832 [Gardnerella vaginalis JCP7276]
MLILNANRHKHIEFFAILHVKSYCNTFAIFTKVKNTTAILVAHVVRTRTSLCANRLAWAL